MQTSTDEIRKVGKTLTNLELWVWREFGQGCQLVVDIAKTMLEDVFDDRQTRIEREKKNLVRNHTAN